MPTYIRSGSWKQVKEIYVRVGNAWKTVQSAWVRVGNLWKEVYSGVETPYPSGDITVRNSLNNIIDNSTYLANVGDTIYGNRGPTWLNNPTAFQYRWRYAMESGGPYQAFSPAETSTSHPSPLNTASPLTRIDEWDGRWIVYEVRAQNALGYSEWFTSVNEANLVKYKPVNMTLSITGTPGPFSTLTAVNTWQTTLINTGDWTPSSFEYNWYDNTTNDLIYTDTVRTFTPTIEDLNRYVRVEVTATNTGGSTTAVSAAVGPIEFVLAVETPTVTQDNGDIALDNRGGIINGIFIKVSATIYGVTEYTSYRVRYRYRQVNTGTYLLYGAPSTATASWVTRTANPSGFGDITNVDVDDVNRVTNLQDVSYIDPIWYDGSTYSSGSIVSAAQYQVEIQVSVVRPDNTTVNKTLTYGISAAPVPTINTASTTVGTGRDVVFTGTVGGFAGKPAYPIEVFLDFDDGNVETQLFSEGARNPTYSITHQFDSVGTYDVEVSTDPPYASATKSITVSLAPGSFDIVSVVKGLSNGSTRPVTVTWEESVNATAYEVQIQRQYSDLSGWVTVQTFAVSTYTFEPTRTATFNVSPVAKYYRASVRATRFTDLDTAAYSGGGTLASPVYVEAEGIPAGAPTSLSVSDILTTSATISFTAPTSFGSAGLNTYQWSLDNITWNSTFSSTSPAYVYDLTAGTSTTVYIRALNLDDVGGTSASITFTTAAGPKPFNITSAVKAAYDTNLVRSDGAGNDYPGTGGRAVTINWSQSLDATQYEVQIEGRDYHPIVTPGNSQTWVMIRSLDLAPYINEPTRTETFNAIVFWQYRVTARARTSGNLQSAAYSDGGSATSFVYFTATGTGPGKPTIGTITPSKNSASVAFTNPTSTGSAPFIFSQWSLDQLNWTRVDTSPFTIPNLNSEFFYTVYMRSFNYDGESSATPHAFKSFTTPAAKPPNTPTSPTTSGVTSTNITFSWTAPSTDATHGAATSYIYYTNTTGSTPSSGGTSIQAPTTSVSFTYTASASPVTRYFWVRAVNDDGESSLTTAVSATPTAVPSNSIAPGISTNTGNYSAGSIITGTTGTWNNAASYLIQIVRSSTTPITSDATSPVSNVYTITNADAADPSYYFAVKVTAYSGAGQTGASAVAYSATSPISTLVPTVTTPTLGTPTNTGFPITWTSGPNNYHTSNVQIYNASQVLLTTISDVTSPYTWAGASANTTYYVKIRVVAQDTSATSVTSGFSSSITTLPNAPLNEVAPTVAPSSGAAGVTTYNVTNNGTWSGSPTFTYQWQYLSGNIFNIPSATSSSYSPPSNYVSLYGTDLRCLVTATNSGGSNSAASNAVKVAPAASNLATVDATLTPGNPSSITVANTLTTNQGKVSWTNGSNATSSWVSSVTPGSSFTGTDGGPPLLTEQVFDITSSATAVATVNNKNNNKRVTISWDQTAGSASYRLNYTITNAGLANGTYNQNGNSTASSASFTVTLGNVSGTVRANSVTVYSGANQTGESSTFTPATAPSTSPVDKTSSSTGSGTVRATPVNVTAPTLTPTSGTAGTTTFSVNSNGTWDYVDLNTVYTYRWQYLSGNPQNISGATSSTYTPPSNYVTLYGSSLRCVVTATNTGGLSAERPTSNVATVSSPLPPAQVTGVTATVTSLNRPYNNGEIGVSWTAPADNGSPITGYFVEYSSNGGSSWVTFTSNWTSGTGFGSSPWSVGTYIFRVAAISAAGTGAKSANSNNAVVTTVPQAPTIGTATAGNGTVSVSFTAGATGGSAITGFTVTSSSGNTGTGSSSPISVSDTNGTARTYTVTATNANGTSVASAASNSATPFLSAPAGGTVSISTDTGNYNIGSVITYSTTGWSGSPTSYSLRLYNGTNPVLTSDPLRASTTGTSGTYTITSADATKFFKAFATATNAGGTSTEASSTQVGPTPAPVVAIPVNISAPTTSGNLSVGSVVTYGVGSWSNSPTGYDLRLYRGTAGVVMSETLVGIAGSATSATYTIRQEDFDSGQRYLRAYASATNSGGTSAYAAGNEIGPITAVTAPAPVLVSITGNNSLPLGGTFTWSFTNSPTSYSILCTGPSGSVYTTSNAFTYSGTTFRPAYDGTGGTNGTGWQGSGTYTMYVTARNAGGGTSTTASVSVSMS
jgi:hypothetical protein